jgi:hypothetical protein
VDVQGYYGKQMLLFFLLGMLVIAANFFLMALGIWWAGHPWFQKI